MSSLLPALGPVVDAGTDAPLMPYWQLFTRPDGLSSVELAMLGGFAKKSVGGKAAAMWMRAVPGAVEAVQFVILPVGWVGEWHESPTSQWVVTLSGRWFIETQDGTRIEMGPGEIHRGQDLGTGSVDGNHGHRSGQLGDAPCAQLLVQYGAPSGGVAASAAG